MCIFSLMSLPVTSRCVSLISYSRWGSDFLGSFPLSSDYFSLFYLCYRLFMLLLHPVVSILVTSSLHLISILFLACLIYNFHAITFPCALLLSPVCFLIAFCCFHFSYFFTSSYFPPFFSSSRLSFSCLLFSLALLSLSSVCLLIAFTCFHFTHRFA